MKTEDGQEVFISTYIMVDTEGFWITDRDIPSQLDFYGLPPMSFDEDPDYIFNPEAFSKANERFYESFIKITNPQAKWKQEHGTYSAVFLYTITDGFATIRKIV